MTFAHQMNPKISIIVPVYNSAEYLEECISSLICQSLPEIEILIVDDGSTDNSWDILVSIAAEIVKIKLYRQKNQGQGAARNLALTHAAGEYILFVDSDDWIDKETCEILYNSIQLSNSNILCFNYILNYSETERIITSYPSSTLWEDEKCLEALFDAKITGHACNKLYKRSMLHDYGLFFPDEGVYEDLLFSIKVLYYAKRVQYITDAYYHYRIREHSSSRSEDIRLVDQLKMLNHGIEFLKEHNSYGFYQKKIKRLFSVSFIGILKRIFDKKHEREVLEALKQWQDYVSLGSLRGYEFFIYLLFKLDYRLSRLFYKRCVLKVYPIIKKAFSAER